MDGSSQLQERKACANSELHRARRNRRKVARQLLEQEVELLRIQVSVLRSQLEKLTTTEVTSHAFSVVLQTETMAQISGFRSLRVLGPGADLQRRGRFRCRFPNWADPPR